MFSQLLKELRTQKGVTQTDLARAIGVSNGNVGDWERGRSKPGYDSLVALSRFFEISAGQLLEVPDIEGDLTYDDIPLVDRIEKLIKEKGLSFKRVEKDCKLGNGTIKRWKDQSPRLDKLVSVAEYLHVSLDYLVFGRNSENSPNGEHLNLAAFKKEQSLLCDGNPLSSLETDLVAMFRLLPSTQQEEVFDFVYFKYKKNVEKEKESIYWTYFSENTETGKKKERNAVHETA